jgi:outer membrane lipoprotein-sorting protein
VRRAVIVDGQGNTNSFDFGAAVLNVAVDPSECTFTPPQGTTIARP